MERTMILQKLKLSADFKKCIDDPPFKEAQQVGRRALLESFTKAANEIIVCYHPRTIYDIS